MRQATAGTHCCFYVYKVFATGLLHFLATTIGTPEQMPIVLSMKREDDIKKGKELQYCSNVFSPTCLGINGGRTTGLQHHWVVEQR